VHASAPPVARPWITPALCAPGSRSHSGMTFCSYCDTVTTEGETRPREGVRARQRRRASADPLPATSCASSLPMEALLLALALALPLALALLGTSLAASE